MPKPDARPAGSLACSALAFPLPLLVNGADMAMLIIVREKTSLAPELEILLMDRTVERCRIGE